MLGAWQGKGGNRYLALSIFVHTVSVLAYQRSQTSYGIRLLKVSLTGDIVVQCMSKCGVFARSNCGVFARSNCVVVARSNCVVFG